MRRYETIVIIDPDLSGEGREPLLDRLRQLVSDQGGILVEIDEWGAKKLAYEIKKKKRGYYARIDYCGNGALVDEMERFFRIDDRVLKYMTILLEKDTDTEAIKAEIEAANADQDEADSAPEPVQADTAKADTAPGPEAPATDDSPSANTEAGDVKSEAKEA